VIEDPHAHVVSVASQWELMIKSMAGKLPFPDVAERFLLGIPKELGLQAGAGRSLDTWPPWRSPPDPRGSVRRMLVAQTLVEDLDLVTDDEVIRRHPVRTMWCPVELPGAQRSR
jgi:PIN domain nuclease of toxin-antitoxin system